MFQPKISSEIQPKSKKDDLLGLRIIVDIEKFYKTYQTIKTVSEDYQNQKSIKKIIKEKYFNNVIITIKKPEKPFMESFKTNSVKFECSLDYSFLMFEEKNLIDYPFYSFLLSRNMINPIYYDSEFIYITLPYFEGITYFQHFQYYNKQDKEIFPCININTDYNIVNISYDIVQPKPNFGFFSYISIESRYQQKKYFFNNDHYHQDLVIGFYFQDSQQNLDNIDYLIMTTTKIREEFYHRNETILKYTKNEPIIFCEKNTFLLEECYGIYIKPVFKEIKPNNKLKAYFILALGNKDGILRESSETPCGNIISKTSKEINHYIKKYNIKLPYTKDIELEELKMDIKKNIKI